MKRAKWSAHWGLGASVAVGLAAAACGDESSSKHDETKIERPDREPFSPGEAPLRRLTSAQYLRIAAELVGPDGVLPARLEEDKDFLGLPSLGAGSTAVSFIGVERYESAAFLIAAQALAKGANRSAIVPCEPKGTIDTACTEQFVRQIGRKLFRRTLTEDEITTFAGIAESVANDSEIGDFHTGLEFALAGLLQSPDFLYRIEVGSPSPDDPNRLRLSDVEMASRLSFFFWGDAPDIELLDVAEAGELSDPATLAAQVDRLIADDRIRTGIRTFFDEMLKLGELTELEKDPSVFTAYSAELGPSAREATLRDLERLVVDEDGDFRSLLTRRETHVDRTLAAVYRIPAPSIEGFGLAAMPTDQGRVGLFGQASFLALNSHAASTSAVKRGKFVQEVLLCRHIPPPPPFVNTVLPEATEDAVTLRDRVAVHLTDPGCAACHGLMDPIGLAFEHFDAIGSYRPNDQGAEIDPSGDLEGQRFDDARGLAEVIARDPAFADCVVETLYGYAVGRGVAPAELVELDGLQDHFAGNGYSVLKVMRAIATSPRFWDAAPQSGDPPATCEPTEEGS